MNVQTPAQSAHDAAVDVGRIFGQGGTDGLILYALILATFLMFLALVILSLLNYRERRAFLVTIENQGRAFSEASNEASEALKDVATALAASASADMTFKQAQAGLLERADQALQRLEARRR